MDGRKDGRTDNAKTISPSRFHRRGIIREGHRATLAEQLQEIEDAIRENNKEDVQLLIKTIENSMLSLENTDANILSRMITTAEEVKETALYNIRVKRKLQNYKKLQFLSDSPRGTDRDKI
jgi:translation initiation factor 2 beta subunit (eIF-2beta)/eIF-5